jgi:hypothetical protein
MQRRTTRRVNIGLVLFINVLGLRPTEWVTPYRSDPGSKRTKANCRNCNERECRGRGAEDFLAGYQHLVRVVRANSLYWQFACVRAHPCGTTATRRETNHPLDREKSGRFFDALRPASYFLLLASYFLLLASCFLLLARNQYLPRSFANTTRPVNPPRRIPARTSSSVAPMKMTCVNTRTRGCAFAAILPSSTSEV